MNQHGKFNHILISKLIPLERVRSLLTMAFEGGSNYWMNIHSYALPNHRKPSFYGPGSDLQPINDWWPKAVLMATTDATVLLEDTEPDCVNTSYLNDDGLYELNMPKVTAGLQAFSELEQQQHYAKFLFEDDDAETADIFLQCCLFKEIIYG